MSSDSASSSPGTALTRAPRYGTNVAKNVISRAARRWARPSPTTRARSSSPSASSTRGCRRPSSQAVGRPGPTSSNVASTGRDQPSEPVAVRCGRDRQEQRRHTDQHHRRDAGSDPGRCGQGLAGHVGEAPSRRGRAGALPAAGRRRSPADRLRHLLRAWTTWSDSVGAAPLPPRPRRRPRPSRRGAARPAGTPTGFSTRRAPTTTSRAPARRTPATGRCGRSMRARGALPRPAGRARRSARCSAVPSSGCMTRHTEATASRARVRARPSSVVGAAPVDPRAPWPLPARRPRPRSVRRPARPRCGELLAGQQAPGCPDQPDQQVERLRLERHHHRRR